MKELQLIQSELKANKGQFNKFGNYKYRSCEDILEAVKPLLEKNNCSIVISDDLQLIGDRYYIKATSTIINSNGERLEASAYAREPLNQKGMAEPQVTGSASSYSRKYSLNGLFAIDDTKDADTQDNSSNKPAQQYAPAPKADKPKFTLENSEDAGDYVATVGKYKGQKVSEIKKEDLISYCGYITKESEPTGPMKAFVDHARNYVMSSK